MPATQAVRSSSSPFMRISQHPTELRAWCKQCLPGRLKPDVLRPVIVGTRGPMVTRLRPCMTTSTPPSRPSVLPGKYLSISYQIHTTYEQPPHLRAFSRKLSGRSSRSQLRLPLLLCDLREDRPQAGLLDRCPSGTSESASSRAALSGSTVHPPHFTGRLHLSGSGCRQTDGHHQHCRRGAAQATGLD